MKIYGLTSTGISVARNIRNPNEPKYQIINYLFKVNRSELQRIANYINMTPMETARIIRRDLRGLVAEE
jgi:predicted HTH domain antitoxin